MDPPLRTVRRNVEQMIADSRATGLRSMPAQVEDVELDLLSLTYRWVELQRGRAVDLIGRPEVEAMAHALTERLRAGLNGGER